MKMNISWGNGLHRRNFISTFPDDIPMENLNLVTPLNRFTNFDAFALSDVYLHEDEELSKRRTRILIGTMVSLVVVSAFAGFFIGRLEAWGRKSALEPPDPVVAPPPSWSKLRTFTKGAVCTDAPQCSKIGRGILEKNGTAVDAAIAAMFCNGLLNMQSMGLGGGFFMTVYLKDEGSAYSVVARETAPAAATENMFHGDYSKSSKGPLSVAVPGELRGMWAAHKRWGSVPWADLIKPTIEICKDGFLVSKAMYDGILSAQYIFNDPLLRMMYYDSERKMFNPPGSRVHPSPEFCNTLSIIAEKGGDELYNGTLAESFAADLNRMGTIITADDLRNYQAKISAPLAVKLSGGDVLYTPPPPSSGAILVYILNILSGYGFSSESLTTTDSMILTYHRILESFKHAYAMRTKLGDVDFLDLDQLISNITSVDFASSTRNLISDFMTSNNSALYGAEEYTKTDSGTAHLSVISANGDAVSVTSSINYYYGAGMTSRSTGIVLNNVMDDFSSPGITNYFGIKPSPANFIKPGKRPLSSMSPSIVVDGSGNAKLVIGASGGTKITTAVALVTLRKLWLDQDIKQAVDAPRIHHQIFPMYAEYEYGVIEDVVTGLRAKGHGMVRYKGRGSVICALYRNRTGIYANADYRKGGDVDGI